MHASHLHYFPLPPIAYAIFIGALVALFTLIQLGLRRKAAGKEEIPLSPIAVEIVRRIDALFEMD